MVRRNPFARGQTGDHPHVSEPTLVLDDRRVGVEALREVLTKSTNRSSEIPLEFDASVSVAADGRAVSEDFGCFPESFF